MQIVEKVKSLLPSEVVSRIELEGSEIIVYTKDKQFFQTHESIIRSIVDQIKKRIEVRPEKNILLDQEVVKEKIREMVPKEAGIKDIYFEPERSLVIIAAEKPGLVIGKSGETLRKIKAETFWVPRIERVPPIKSEIVEGIRKVIHVESKFRKEFLNKIGEKIFTPKETKRDWIRIIGLGGWREVGRSCILLETPKSKILIDCGVSAGAMNASAFPILHTKEFDPNEIDAIIISHAHLDHCGAVPYLYEFGYSGPLYCTTPTLDLFTLLTLDYIDVMQRNGINPFFTAKGVKEAVKHAITLEYNEVSDIAPDVRLTLANAGHILGSALIHLHIGEGMHNILYAADQKFAKTNLLDPAQTNFQRVETLITESTYGGNDDIMPPLPEAEKQFMDIVNRTMERGGIALIPSFCVERGQEVMTILANNNFQYPVFIDGMIWEANGIFTAYPEYMGKSMQKRIFSGDNPLTNPMFKRIASQQEREKAWEEKPCVILSTSGMLSVEGEEPILVKKGETIMIEKIGNIVDSIIETSPRKYKICGVIEGDVAKSNSVEVAAYNFESGRIEFYPISFVVRHTVHQPIYEIVLNSGRMVKISPSHSILTLERGKIIAKRVDELKVGDYVLIPTKIDGASSSTSINFIELLLKRLPENLARKIYVQNTGIEGKTTWQKLHNTVPLSRINASNKLNETVTLRFKSGSKYKIPAIIKLTPEVMRLFGYYAAEGYTSISNKSRNGIVALTFGINEEKLIKDACRCIRKVFGIDPKIVEVPEKGYTRVTIGGKLLAYIFKYCLDVGCKASEKRIPRFVFSTTKENQLEFIKAYFLGDGSINRRKGRIEIEFDSASQQMISDLCYLFSFFGIFGDIERKEKKERIIHNKRIGKTKIYRLVIRNACSLKQIANMFLPSIKHEIHKIKEKSLKVHYLPLKESNLRKIGELIEPKNEKKKFMKIRLLSKRKLSFRKTKEILEKVKSILFEQGRMDEFSKTITLIDNITKGYIGIDKVREIKKVGPSSTFLYDVSVDGLENFVGGRGGILLHNTGGPVIDHLKHLAEDEKNTLIFVGYQCEGTLGRRIQKGWTEIPFKTEEGKTITLNLKMEVQTVDGLSGHSDKNQLLGFINRLSVKPEKVICVHGEPKKTLELAKAIHKIFRIETAAPRNLEAIRLK